MSLSIALPDASAAGGNAAEQNMVRESERERSALQYLLGVYARSRPTVRKALRRKAFYPDAVRSLEEALRAVHAPPLMPVGIRHIQVNSLCLTRKLYQMWHEFPSHINDDEARKRFLKGYLDFCYSAVLCHNNTLEFHIRTSLSPARERLLESFFELGIYPVSRPSGITISTYHNIMCLRALDLAPALHNKKTDKYLAAYAWPHIALPEAYYRAREQIAAVYGKKAVNWKKLSRELGISPDTLQRWSADIRQPHRGHKSLRQTIPAVVRCYEKLLTRFGLPNVYTSLVPVQRHEKLFIPINGKKYCLDRSMQQRYFEMYELPYEPLTEEHRRHLHSELGSYLTGRINDIRFSLKGTTVTGMWLSKGW